MKITHFPTQALAQEKLDEYNALARHESNASDFSLTSVNSHTTQPFYWFNADECIENGGLHKAQIAADVAMLDIVDIEYSELVALGYLPQPLMVE